MKRHWLRGMLLGISLSLLLAGGVALAQGMTMTADQDCAECWPGPYDVATPDEYVVQVVFDGFDPAETLCVNVWVNGESLMEDGGPSCGPAPGLPPLTAVFVIPCGPIGAVEVSGLGVTLRQDGIEDLYGEWKMHAWQPGVDKGDTVFWTFAEDCAAEEAVQFVPEPGTVALLGSGLAGLAGYAALRWRARS